MVSREGSDIKNFHIYSFQGRIGQKKHMILCNIIDLFKVGVYFTFAKLLFKYDISKEWLIPIGGNKIKSNVANIEGSTLVSIENFIVHILAKGNYFNLIERWFCAELGKSSN